MAVRRRCACTRRVRIHVIHWYNTITAVLEFNFQQIFFQQKVHTLISNNYRSQRSWAKVIFSQACVCPRGGGLVRGVSNFSEVGLVLEGLQFFGGSPIFRGVPIFRGSPIFHGGLQFFQGGLQFFFFFLFFFNFFSSYNSC